MHLVQSTWSVFTITLKLYLIYVIGFRTILTAVLLRGWNLTLALLVRAFVPTFYVQDVIHDSSPSGLLSGLQTPTSNDRRAYRAGAVFKVMTDLVVLK
jgi:hypothetical protein